MFQNKGRDFLVFRTPRSVIISLSLLFIIMLCLILTSCQLLQGLPDYNDEQTSRTSSPDYAADGSQETIDDLVVDITERPAQTHSSEKPSNAVQTIRPAQTNPAGEQSTPKPTPAPTTAGESTDQISWLITPDFINWDTMTGTWKLIDIAPSPFYLLHDKTERDYAENFCADYIDWLNRTASENPGYEYRMLFRSDGLCATYDIPGSVEPTLWYWCSFGDLNRIDMILYKDATTEWTQENLNDFSLFSAGDYTVHGGYIILDGEEHFCQVIYLYEGRLYRSRKFLSNYIAFEIYEKVSESEYIYGY